MEKSTCKRVITFIACFAVLLALFMVTASASETIPGTVVETATVRTASLELSTVEDTSLEPIVTETGKISISVDGLGTDAPGIIQVEKPDGATVRSAYLFAATVWGYPIITDGAIQIDGQGVNWDGYVHKYTYNHWADVTSLVQTKIDNATAGRIDFTISETNSYAVDGTVLVVIFDDPNQESDNTIVLLFGAQDINGDTFNLRLAEPIDTSTPDMSFDMGIGISYSYQLNSAQYSIINVNGNRLTSSAGGQDDGIPFGGNGKLLTVGGLDDSNANPVDPYQTAYSDPRLDDELYNILPFVEDGDDTITVYTQNPSNDDNIFFAYFNLKSTIAIVGEGIVLGPASATNTVGTYHTVTATVQDDDGNPVASKEVTFEVVSGPHQGMSTTVATESNGEAMFTYQGTSEGTDTIVASFVNSQEITIYSNEVIKTWEIKTTIPEDPNHEIPEFPTIALPIAAILGLAFVFMRRK